MSDESNLSEATAARLAAIIRSSDDAIVSKTVDGIITSWNPAAERMFGWTAEEAVGQSITIIIPPERLGEETQVLAKIRRGEMMDHFDTVRVAKDGRQVHISLTVSPIRDASGTIIGASKIARDITERKRLEEERELALAKEREARAEAESFNRIKDQFLAVLSHELRTPLNAIFGWASILQEGPLEPDTLGRGVDAILRNATAQLRLIEDLLDVSRIITGNMRLDVTTVDLRAVIEAGLDTVRPAAAAKNIRLESILGDPAASRILGAADRLQQVVWNLLMNAVKFTPRNGRVQIVLQRVGSRVAIVVSDTGEGIAPDLLPYIFDRFRQGDSSSTRPHGGLGLGLALVRHLVELHGGWVKAESPGPGKGATFTVELPVTIIQPNAEGGRPSGSLPDDAAADPRRALHGLRVMLVDDDRDSLDLGTTVLVRAGAEVRTALSAASALEALEEWPADVIVCDIEMPEEDGYTLLRRLRGLQDRRGRIPALALTAYSRTEDRKRSLAAGFNLHLSKPVDPAELVLAIASVAGRTNSLPASGT